MEIWRQPSKISETTRHRMAAKFGFAMKNRSV